MNNIDEILQRLQTQQPMLEDEDTFIDSIMDSLPDLPEEMSGASPFIIALRAFSSLAASVVIGLFIFLNVDSPSHKSLQSAETEHSAYASYAYADLSDCTTPQEAMKKYTEKKSMDINKLISLYNGN